MARPCVGCGFTVDNNGSLNINGLASSTYPYTAQTTTPNDIFCDGGTNELWVKPWGTAWGIVAKNIKTSGNGAAMTAGTTWINTNLDTTISFTAVANRMYKHTVLIPVVTAMVSTSSGVNAILATAGNTGLVVDTFSPPVGTFYNTFHLTYIGTETAGTKSFKVLVSNNSGTVGTIQTVASDPNRFIYVIEDIGPAI